MKLILHKNYEKYRLALAELLSTFESSGMDLGEPARNTIKVFDFQNSKLNVKSFKVPMFVNGVIYRYLRRSKAQRSFEYATILLEKGIKTPFPIGYAEQRNLLLRKSFYVSEHLQADLTFRELTTDLNFPEHDIILRQFTAFCFALHENGIEFLDHTPGNTLIIKDAPGQYSFYLVDLNRMNFHPAMTLEQRIQNLSKLTAIPSLIATMSEEYAKLYNADAKVIFDSLMHQMTVFQNKLIRKKKLKKQLLFWR